MDGYCIADEAPVFPGRDLSARVITREVREEAFGDVRDEAAAELVERDLDDNAECLSAVYDTAGTMDATPLDKLLADLEADNVDDWLRLLAVCPVRDQSIAALNFQQWLMQTMQAASWVQQAAERIAVRRLKL